MFFSQLTFAQSREELIKVQQFINEGSTSFSRGDYKTAIENFSKAINIYPKSSELFYNRGTAYLLNSEFDLAIKDFDTAIDKGKTLPEKRLAEFYMNRGLAFQSKGDYAKSIEDLSQAVLLNPEEVRIYLNRGNYLCLIEKE